jgi:hypothetical protein
MKTSKEMYAHLEHWLVIGKTQREFVKTPRHYQRFIFILDK